MMPIQLIGQTEIPHLRSGGVTSASMVREKSLFDEYQIFFEVKNPETLANYEAKGHFYRFKNEDKCPLLIIAPPINGVSSREKSVVRHFLKEGYHCLIVEPVVQLSTDTMSLSAFGNGLLSLVSVIRSAVDVMESYEEVDTANVFLWGASLGSMYSSLAFCADERIKACVLLLGGCRISDVVTNSNQRTVSKYRETRMMEEGIESDAEFQTVLNNCILYDPSDYAAQRMPQDVFFVYATEDSSVPSENQLQLYAAFGKPEHCREYHCGHVMALFRSHFFHLAEYSEFLNGKLGE
ncbi:MAG: hypothetical protein KDC12_13405 [Flavobacteriales bacterium]|nr:hypothetical protein [Flavobacteriales bacterium]